MLSKILSLMSVGICLCILLSCYIGKNICYKKLCKEREESLSAKLVTGKQNPVGILGVLNRHYQWNMPGVSKETSTRKALDASQLPQLGGSSNAKSAELPVIEVENS